MRCEPKVHGSSRPVCNRGVYNRPLIGSYSTVLVRPEDRDLDIDTESNSLFSTSSLLSVIHPEGMVMID